MKNNVVTNVEITPRHKILTLDGTSPRYDLRGIKETYPNITALKIQKGVESIKMLNKTFPNIRKVTSTSPEFLSGEMLVQAIRDEKKIKSKILLNAFCRNNGEILDLSGISSIENMALDGCIATEIVNDKSLVGLYEDSLTGSAFDAEQIDGDGPIFFGSYLVGFKKDTSVFTLTDSIKKIIWTSKCKPIPMLVVNDYKLLKVFDDIPDDVQVCDTLRIEDNRDFKNQIKTFDVKFPAAHIIITPENKALKTKNDSICNADGSTVYTSAWFLTGKAIIPDGVKSVENIGYPSANITSLEIPSSVESMDPYCIWNADRLSLVKCDNENLPEGCISAILVATESLGLGEDTDNNVIEIITQNAHAFIPRYTTQKSANLLDKKGSTDMASMNDAYEYASSDNVKYDVIRKSYEFSKDKKLEKILKDEAVSILLVYIRNGRIQAALDFVDLNLFTPDALNDMLSDIGKDTQITKANYDKYCDGLKKLS